LQEEAANNKNQVDKKRGKGRVGYGAVVADKSRGGKRKRGESRHRTEHRKKRGGPSLRSKFSKKAEKRF